MGTLGSFLKGAVAGIIGLGIVSWLVSTSDEEHADDETEWEDR